MDDNVDDGADSHRLNQRLVARLTTRLRLSDWVRVASPQGRRLIRRGDVIERLPVIVSGVLDAVADAGADPAKVSPSTRFGVGELALMSYLFTRDPVDVDLVVVADATFHWVPIEAVEDAVRRSEDLLWLMVRHQSRCLRERG